MLKRPGGINITLTLLILSVLMFSLAVMAQTHPAALPLRARQLIGMKVEDSDGQKAGTIRNLVLNMNTGNLRYVVIGSGGYFGVHATLKLAPVQVMSPATVKRQTLAIHVSTPHWRDAPVFKYRDLAAIAEPGGATEISRYFQISANKPAPEAERLPKTGRDVSTIRKPADLKFASDLIGMRVVNQKQEKIGEVLDLLVSFGEPHPAFVIVSSGRLFHQDYQYAVRLNVLSRSNNKLILDADTAALQQAPLFDQTAWESRTNSSPQVYHYLTPTD